MTAAELVACATRLYQRAAFADNAIYYQNDQKAYEHARAAFHEAGRLLDFCATKTCGTCADYIAGQCDNSASPVASAIDYVPEDFGCPYHERKEAE